MTIKKAEKIQSKIKAFKNNMACQKAGYESQQYTGFEYINYDIKIKNQLIKAKANLEKLGCGKDCGNFICGDVKGMICSDCQKAKEIYEEILE